MFKTKPEPTTTISIRIPMSLKGELESLRKLADKHGFDLGSTLSERIQHILKEFRSELEGFDKKPASHANGAATKEG
jgi:hypothetical protein